MDLREDRQCIFYFFEDLNFTEIEDQDQDAWGWVQNHEGEVQAWISCVPSE
ncbi:MAG: hypothetical protein GY938_11385, partial [Ketobacter sp.]|nr:hypothetical protein [Ketobacter sp.]